MWLISFTCFASIINEHFFVYPYLHKTRKIFLFFISFSHFYFSFFHKKKLIARNNCSGISVYFNSLPDITFACVHSILLLYLMPTVTFPQKKKTSRKKCVDIKENCVRLWTHLMTFYKVLTLIKNFLLYYLYFCSIYHDISARGCENVQRILLGFLTFFFLLK